MRTTLLRAPSIRFYGAWKPFEDTSLLKAHEKHGPAWTIVSFGLYGRTPEECRKRHLRLSNALETVKDPRAFHSIFHEGFEPAKDGTFIRFPVEEVDESPIAKLAAGLARPPRRTKRQLNGEEEPWSRLEMLVVREGYEAMGPNWTWIAEKLHRRTPEQVKALMERMSAEFNLQE
jgi:hypothetical protein